MSIKAFSRTIDSRDVKRTISTDDSAATVIVSQ